MKSEKCGMDEYWHLFFITAPPANVWEEIEGEFSMRQAMNNRIHRTISSRLLFFLFTMAISMTAHEVGGDQLWQFGDLQTGKQEATASSVDGDGNVVIVGYSHAATNVCAINRSLLTSVTLEGLY